MSRYIVITTINKPTEGIGLYTQIPNVRTVVVGDRKTPPDWHCDNAIFLPVSEQLVSRFALASCLPYDHYARKNLGYIYAIKAGAEAIVDTDDDNRPKPNWEFPPFTGFYAQSRRHLGFTNIYKLYTKTHIWPRGFPLDLINSDAHCLSDDSITLSAVKVGVWQGLVDNDPDVDAIYRLVVGKACIFDDKPPIVLSEGTICPFNSQNTIFCRELFPLLYLPSSVSMRFTDILRGLIAQPIMWHYGWALGFTGATAVQVRNPHDYLDDFRLEIPCYLHPYDVVNAVIGAVHSGTSLTDNLVAAYESLCKAKIVDPTELTLVGDWLRDIGY